jgi:hypothetical protein
MHLQVINTILFLLITSPVISQEVNEEQKESMKGSHRITLGLGHTQLSKGKNAEGNIDWLGMPSWSLNYDYWIDNKWAAGLQTDLVLETFVVEENDGDEIEREKPVAIVPVAIYKSGKHWSFFAGAGIEFEKEENLGLTRLGVEYGAELPKGWEAGIGVIWDNKWSHYNSWAIEFTFSKIFSRRTK